MASYAQPDTFSDNFWVNTSDIFNKSDVMDTVCLKKYWPLINNRTKLFYILKTSKFSVKRGII